MITNHIKNYLNTRYKQENYRIDPLKGDASSRMYYRLYINENPFILCYDKTFNTKDHDFIKVQQFLFENDIKVPQIIDYNIDQHFILQEDLGSKNLLHHLSSVNSLENEKTIYQGLIDQLIKIQKIDITQYNGLSSPLSFLNRWFDYQKYDWEINFTHKYFIDHLLNYKLNQDEIDHLSSCFKQLISFILEEKNVFVHRDFHSKNIMFFNNQYYFIDFQDARIGAIQYDLASLLDDCYYQINPELKNSLIKYYWDQWGQMISCESDFNQFNKRYDYMTIQRNYKALGTFAFQFTEKNTSNYLKYIGKVIENIKSILFKYPELSPLRKILMKAYYEH